LVLHCEVSSREIAASVVLPISPTCTLRAIEQASTNEAETLLLGQAKVPWLDEFLSWEEIIVRKTEFEKPQL